MKKYALRKKIPEKLNKIFENYNPLVRELLFARGIVDMKSAEKFLNPDYEKDLHDPHLLKNMKKVVDRIVSAIENSEKIAIYSDYDADGIPGAVALHDFFKITSAARDIVGMLQQTDVSHRQGRGQGRTHRGHQGAAQKTAARQVRSGGLHVQAK